MKKILLTRLLRRFVYAPFLVLVLTITVAMPWSPTNAEAGRSLLPRFNTVDFDELHASFAYPTDWHVAFAKGKLMGSLVITERPNIAETALARFTVNPVSNLMRVRFRRVSEQIGEFEAAFSANSNPRLLAKGSVQIGNYTGSDLLLRTEHSDRTSTIERRLYLAHDRRDWLVIIRFVAPESRWDEMADVRNGMFRRVTLK